MQKTATRYAQFQAAPHGSATFVKDAPKLSFTQTSVDIVALPELLVLKPEGP